MQNEKTNRSNLVKVVVEKLLLDIASGKLKAGHTLPAEPILAEQLGISRPTLRQALKPLESAGIIRAKPRVGTILCTSDPSALAPLFAAHMALAGVSKIAITEARLVLEQTIVRLSALHRTRKDLAAMRAALEQQSTEDLTFEERLEAEQHFHGALIHAAHNPVLASFRDILTLYFDHVATGIRRQDRKQQARTIKEHRQIYEAIREKREEKASMWMRVHLEPTLKLTRTSLPPPQGTTHHE